MHQLLSQTSIFITWRGIFDGRAFVLRNLIKHLHMQSMEDSELNQRCAAGGCLPGHGSLWPALAATGACSDKACFLLGFGLLCLLFGGGRHVHSSRLHFNAQQQVAAAAVWELHDCVAAN